MEYNIQTNIIGFGMQVEVESFEASHKNVRTRIRAHHMCEKLIKCPTWTRLLQFYPLRTDISNPHKNLHYVKLLSKNFYTILSDAAGPCSRAV